MDIVGQLLAALTLSTRAAFTVFCACMVALASDHYHGELFEGLPAWVTPAIRLVAIFSFFLWFIPVVLLIMTKVASATKQGVAHLVLPVQQARIRKTVLGLPINAKYLLLFALSQQSQDIYAPRSAAITLRMLDLKLLERRPWGDPDDFRIPDLVWRTLLTIDGFAPVDSAAMPVPWRLHIPENRLLRHIPERFHQTEF